MHTNPCVLILRRNSVALNISLQQKHYIFLNFFLYLELQTYGNALQLLYIFRIIFSLQHGRKYVEVFLSEISEHRDSTALVLK